MPRRSRLSAPLLGLALALGPVASHATEGETPYRQRAHHVLAGATTAQDVETEIEFGRTIAARVLGRYALDDDAALNRYVNLVGSGIALHSGRGELTYRFAVLDSEHINAYSAPGGYIFITRGALAQMKDEAELAGVLAHEVAHITERHIVKALSIRAADNSAGSGLSRILNAGTDTARVAIQQAADQAMRILFEDGYQQRDELDADRVATLLLATTGYDPAALHRYITRIQASETTSNNHESVTTHPPSPERLAALRKTLDEEQLHGLHYPTLAERFTHHVKQTR